MAHPRPHIAVVDDDDDIRKSLCRLLRSATFDVDAFASAEDFVSAPHDQPYDCLVLDLRMPGQSGPELHQQMVEAGTDIPTILMSAHEDDLSRTRRSNPNVVDYLCKPFDAQDLLDAVQQAIHNL